MIRGICLAGGILEDIDCKCYGARRARLRYLRIFLHGLGRAGRQLDVDGVYRGGVDFDEDLIGLGDLGRRERCDLIFVGLAIFCERNCAHRRWNARCHFLVVESEARSGQIPIGF
jgi:hypothetical protein